MAIEGMALHTGPVGDCAQGCAGRPDRSMELGGRCGDSLPSIGHRVGALLEPVPALGCLFM
jgi:hypothetical protein